MSQTEISALPRSVLTEFQFCQWTLLPACYMRDNTLVPKMNRDYRDVVSLTGNSNARRSGLYRGRLQLATIRLRDAPNFTRGRKAMDGISSRLGRLRSEISYIVAAVIAAVVIVIFLTSAPEDKTFPLSPQDIAGEWDSTFGVVSLSVSDHKVSGTYAYGEGEQAISGTIDGKIDDAGKVELAWSETGGGGGRAIWHARSKDALSGTWGNGRSEIDGGTWQLQRRAAVSP